MVKLLLLLLLTITLHANIGKIVLLQGDVQIQRGTKTLPAKINTQIFKKDLIRTLKEAHVQIKFKDNTVVTLAPNSDFSIDEYLNSAKNPKVKFSFTRGIFKSITGRIGHIAPKNFILQTKTATIGIRGTIVLGNITPEGDIIACLMGKISVKNRAIGREIIVNAGEATLVKRYRVPTPPVKITKKLLENATIELKNKNAKKQTKTLKTPLIRATNLAPKEIINRVINDTIYEQHRDTTIGAVAEKKELNKNEIVEQIQMHECPTGTMGSYPNCVKAECPAGTTGTYPDCGSCNPQTQTGTYPNCVDLTCPSGTTGTYPDCGSCDPQTQTGTYPNCVDLTCPAGTTGTYPDCGSCDPQTQTGTYPNCVTITYQTTTDENYYSPNSSQVNNTQTSDTSTVEESSPTPIYNADRNQTLYGTFIHGYGDNSYNFFGEGEGNYTLIANRLHANARSSTLYYYDTNGTLSQKTDTKLNDISVDLGNTEATTTYSGYSQVASPVLDFSYTEGGITHHLSGNSILYMDDMQQFFINYNSEWNYLESFGVLTQESDLLINPDVILTYVAPYNSDDRVQLNMINNTFLSLHVPQSIYNGVFGVNIGKYDSSNTLSGEAITMDTSLNNTNFSNIRGNIYGSEHQGMSFQSVPVDTNRSQIIDGFAGYKENSATTAINTKGTLYLVGFANAITKDKKLSSGHDFSYVIDTTFPNSNGGSIYFDNDLDNISIGIGKAAYIDENNFATINLTDNNGSGKGLLFAVDNGNISNLYWGWYLFDNNRTRIIPSSWVAGVQNEDLFSYIEELAPSTVLKYRGKSLGTVLKENSLYTIEDNENNLVSLDITVGKTNPVQGSIAFDAAGTNWNISVNENNSTFSTDYYDSSSISHTELDLADTNSSGELNANLYGKYGESLGGSFNIDIDENNSIVGVVTAKQDYKLHLFGFATSSYSDEQNNTYYTNNDRLHILADNNGTVFGTLMIKDDNNSSIYGQLLLNNAPNSINSINDINITDFDSEGTTLYSDNSYDNEYVSWGYWASNDINETLKADRKNFWVAGKDSDKAATFIDNITTPTIYEYHGKALGVVHDGQNSYAINPNDVTNDVYMKFNFGAGYQNSIDTSSYIRFQANAQNWDIAPTEESPYVYNGSFSDTIQKGTTQDAVDISSGKIEGEFFGDKAQAVGGTFKATSGDMHAIGVFKATGGVTNEQIAQ